MRRWEEEARWWGWWWWWGRRLIKAIGCEWWEPARVWSAGCRSLTSCHTASSSVTCGLGRLNKMILNDQKTLLYQSYLHWSNFVWHVVKHRCGLFEGWSHSRDSLEQRCFDLTAALVSRLYISISPHSIVKHQWCTQA